jgi:hypothetical protein
VANDDEYLRAGYIMVKRIVAFTLLTQLSHLKSGAER